MAPTSKERREVAERLREYSNDVLKDGSLLKTLKDVTGAGSWRYVLDSLAGLIDPTCNLVSTTSQICVDGSRVFYHELSCGHTCASFWSTPPSYCPECGARVV